MLKKILLAIAAVVIVLSMATPTLASEYDYNFGIGDQCGLTLSYFDNNLKTGEDLYSNSTGTVYFCEDTYTIKAFYYNFDFTNFTNVRGYVEIKFNGFTHKIDMSTAAKQSGYVVLDTPIVQNGSIAYYTYYASGTYTSRPKFMEFDLFIEPTIKPEPITNLVVTPAKNSAKVQYVSPIDNKYYLRTDVYLDNNLVGTDTKNINLSGLKLDTEYTLNVQTVFSDGKKVDTIQTFKTLKDTTPPANAASFNATVSNKKDVKLTYTLPSDNDFSYVQIYRDDKLLVDNYKQNTYTDTATEFDKSYTYKIVAVDTTGNKSSGVSKTIKTSAQTADNVSNLYAAIDGKKDVKLSYKLAGDTSYVQIYRDDKLLVDNYKETSYTDKTTAYNTSYVYKVVAVNSAGIVATGTSKTIKTPQSPPKDASSLSYTATSNSVSLKWRNTTLDDFTAITIYRKNNTVAANVRALFSAGDGYTKLHSGKVETYTDNSVEPDTSYKYKITTTIAGVESDGVTVDVKTKPVSVDGGAVDKDNNGDYVVTWTAPTAGKIKVLVDGTEYKIVPAADKKVVIPASVMVYDFWGNPKVTLVPVNDAGEEIGTPAPPKPGTGVGGGLLPSPDELKSVINVEGLVQVGMSLIGLIGGFVLLRLAFLFVPRLIKTIRRSWR